MEKYNNQYRIPSARAGWHSYDGGYYFVTISTHHKEHYFGEIANNQMQLNELGKYVEKQIKISPQIRPDMNMEIPLYVVMPNHVHLIVIIGDNIYNCRDAMHGVSTGNKISPQSKNLASIIRGIKSAITKYANMNEIPFQWQTRFHDRIIRDYEELNHIAQYIENNPAQWEYDKLSKPYPTMNEYEKIGMYL